jgi:ABC-2 type transport system ATP-binding protein
MQAVMGAVAEDGLTVLFSSHIVNDLERVCDHLVVLNNGRVALDGDIEELLAVHRLLLGPRTVIDPRHSATVVQATHSERHTTLLVRDGKAEAAPGWQPHPVSLEELVLAYLRQPTSSGHVRDIEEVSA